MRDRPAIRPLILPTTLIIAGLWLMTGCVYIPMFGRTTEGRNVAREVGAASSDKPIRVLHATRDDVLRILGPAYAEKSDRSALAYAWKAQKGLAIWPLCFAAHSLRSQRTLVLRFDSLGLLRSYQVLRDDERLIDLSPPMVPPLPEDFPPAGPEQQKQVR